MSSTGLPGSGVVCLYAIAEFAYVIEKLKQIFEATPGYEIHYNPNATVDDLKKLPRCAVLVFASHSGRLGPHPFGLKTASSSADHQQSGDIAHSDSSAWITRSFIAAHWRFEADSFVFPHGCKTFQCATNRARCSSINRPPPSTCSIWPSPRTDIRWTSRISCKPPSRGIRAMTSRRANPSASRSTTRSSLAQDSRPS